MAKEIDETSLVTTPDAAAQANPEPKPKKEKRPPKASVQPAQAGDASETAATPAEQPKGPAKDKAAEPASSRNRDAHFEPWYVKREKQRLKQMEGMSMPFLKIKLSLKTRHAQEAFDRSNEFWTEAMITLSETMRNFKPEDQCLTVDSEVDRVLDQCFKTVETEHARLKTVAENSGIDIDDLEIEYTKPHEYKLRIISPRELRFHKLLKDMDAACELMDLLWMMKLVSDRARSKTSYDLKRLILRTSGSIRNLVFRAQASSQRNGVQNAADPRAGTALDPANKVAPVDGSTAVQAEGAAIPQDANNAIAANEPAPAAEAELAVA